MFPSDELATLIVPATAVSVGDGEGVVCVVPGGVVWVTGGV
jgi:hypothetical protein